MTQMYGKGKTYGMYIREQREKMGLTLREVGLRAGMDFSNWAKIERGEWKPRSDGVRTRIANALGAGDSPRWSDRLTIEKGRIPRDIINDPALAIWLAPILEALRGMKREGTLEKKVPKTLRRWGMVQTPDGWEFFVDPF